MILSQPRWKPPLGWLPSWLKFLASIIDQKPIVFCDFHPESSWENELEEVIKITREYEAATQGGSQSDLDFRKFIYLAHHTNPLDKGSLVPLVPPPPLARAEADVEPTAHMQNHIPSEYRKLWRQTEAVARIIAPIKPSLAIRIVTSWQGHRAASCMNIQQCIPQETIPKVPIQNGTAITKTLSASQNPRLVKPFALSIHGYHVDLLLHMLESELEDDLKSRTTLFISLQRGMADALARRLTKRNWQFELIELPNRGRDVLPFIVHQLPRINQLGYRYFAKIHTKRSIHLKTGGDWGQWLGREILQYVSSGAAEQQLSSNPSVGLLAPQGSLVPMTLQLAENARWIEKLITRSEISIKSFISGHFIAGTMMVGRVEAIRPLLQLGLTDEDFEQESGQLDGTLAHSIERIIGAVCMKAGLTLEEFCPGETFETGLGYKNLRNEKLWRASRQLESDH